MAKTALFRIKFKTLNTMINLNYSLISCLLTASLLTFTASAQVEVKEYYENGNIQISGFFNEDSLKTGKWEHFYENGTTKYIVHFENDVLNGYSQEYYENGQLKSEEEYVNGTLNGLYKSYYENGVLKVTGNYENGKRTGEWKQHYTNGQVGETGNFVEGVFTGEGRFYYENGQLMKVFYSDSNKTIDYDENGNLVKTKKKKKKKKKKERIDKPVNE